MEKWEKNHLLWEILRGGTGIKQSGTGTISVMSTGTGTQCSILDQCSYFGHNLDISFTILVIQVSG